MSRYSAKCRSQANTKFLHVAGTPLHLSGSDVCHGFLTHIVVVDGGAGGGVARTLKVFNEHKY